MERTLCHSLRDNSIRKREGVDLDRSTLAGWVGAASELLAPLKDHRPRQEGQLPKLTSIQSGLRLEQEHISFGWLSERLRDLICGNDVWQSAQSR